MDPHSVPVTRSLTTNGGPDAGEIVEANPVQEILSGFEAVKRRLPSDLRREVNGALAAGLRQIIEDQVAVLRQAAAAAAVERRLEATALAQQRALQRRRDFALAQMKIIDELLEEAARLSAVSGFPADIITDLINATIEDIKAARF